MKARQVHAISKINVTLLAQRGHLFCWIPVFLGLGIAGYFALPSEPTVLHLAYGGMTCLGLLVTSRFVPVAVAPVLLGLAIILSGGFLAKARTYAVAGPVLDYRYYGPIQGRIIGIDRSASDAARLTLDQVILSRTHPDRLPARVRVSVHGDDQQWRAGDVIATTGHLSPPAGPAEPRGFDFQRHAWFLQLGGVGYTRNPVVRITAATPDGLSLWIFGLRRAISTAMRTALSGESGAFAAAIMTGDRSGTSKQTMQNLRETNLAHLLAISGLHMGLLTGFIFAVVRIGLATIPSLALRVPTKKVAACTALIVGAVYLMLSGGNVATQRAYIMVAVMLVAVLLDRQALTLRAVAIAATIVLILRPEALIGPGFQMSFAATTALVVVFRGLRHVDLSRLPTWSRPVLSVVVSSAVAGLATAPIAAAHFNLIAHYGLIANLLAVPLMGVVVMPAAVLAVILAPFGLWWVGLSIMDAGLRWILFVAREVAAIEGGVGHVVAPHSVVLGLLALGALWMVLWQGRLRRAGALVVLLSAAIWVQTERPSLLVSDNGSLIGILGAQGRDLSKAKGAGFVASIWLENDGDKPDQMAAAARDYLDVQGRIAKASLGDVVILQVSGKTALVSLNGCAGADILILSVPDEMDRPCDVYDTERLRKTGALSITLDQNGAAVVTTASEVTGKRPWNSSDLRR